VDDVSESRIYGEYQLGRFLYISCWTDSELESIPLWHMYTDKMKGVRIELDSEWMHYQPLRPDPKYGLSQNGIIYSPVPFDKLFTDNYIILPNMFQRQDILKKVKYVDDPSHFLGNVVDLRIGPDGKASLKLSDVNSFATYKQKMWSFQEEVRYVLFILPAIPFPADGFANEDYLSRLPDHILNSIIAGNGPNLEYFDMEIAPSAFENLSITLGPLCEESDSIIVNALLSQYAVKGIVSKSKLTGEIRRPKR
jgi:hypothetical protein